MLKLDLLRQTSVRSQPYPYLVVSQIIEEEYIPQLVADFPDIRHPGSSLVGKAAKGKHQFFHSLSAKLKKGLDAE